MLMSNFRRNLFLWKVDQKFLKHKLIRCIQFSMVDQNLKLRADNSVLFSSIFSQYFIVLCHKLFESKFSNLQLTI